jgi:hypothetical protein
MLTSQSFNVSLKVPDQLFHRDKGVAGLMFTLMSMITFASLIVIPHQRFARVAIIEAVLEPMRSFIIRAR